MNNRKTILLIIIFIGIILAQNEVCFDIEGNPNPFDQALNNFSKYINVLDCFHIYAESSISDAKVKYQTYTIGMVLQNLST